MYKSEENLLLLRFQNKQVDHKKNSKTFIQLRGNEDLWSATKYEALSIYRHQRFISPRIEDYSNSCYPPHLTTKDCRDTRYKTIQEKKKKLSDCLFTQDILKTIKVKRDEDKHTSMLVNMHQKHFLWTIAGPISS